METSMTNADFLSTPELDYEEWRDILRPTWGLYSSADPKAFSGRVRSRSICGFNASDISNNIRHCERTKRDIRLDGVDCYYAIFQVAGRSTIVQGDHAATLTVGEVAFIDSASPLTFHNGGHAQWLSLQLPRQSLISALGFEPQGGFRGRPGSTAGRLLSQLVLNTADDDETMSAPAENYLQFAIYDLLGALFVPRNSPPVSAHTDKLFNRICNVIRKNFFNPEFGPCEVAAEVGISPRYLQTLFAVRGSTCSRFLVSVRLDYAAQLIQRRMSMPTGQPLATIAYACGFRDYTHFARSFRRRFSHPPSSSGTDKVDVHNARCAPVRRSARERARNLS
jgi:AraC family transcriptional activator of tynA and feaB